MAKEDENLIREYAKLHGTSISEFMRQSILEKIEEEYDLRCYEKARLEYEKDSETYTLDEMERELGF